MQVHAIGQPASHPAGEAPVHPLIHMLHAAWLITSREMEKPSNLCTDMLEPSNLCADLVKPSNFRTCRNGEAFKPLYKNVLAVSWCVCALAHATIRGIPGEKASGIARPPAPPPPPTHTHIEALRALFLGSTKFDIHSLTLPNTVWLLILAESVSILYMYRANYFSTILHGLEHDSIWK